MGDLYYYDSPKEASFFLSSLSDNYRDFVMVSSGNGAKYVYSILDTDGTFIVVFDHASRQIIRTFELETSFQVGEQFSTPYGITTNRKHLIITAYDFVTGVDVININDFNGKLIKSSPVSDGFVDSVRECTWLRNRLYTIVNGAEIHSYDLSGNLISNNFTDIGLFYKGITNDRKSLWMLEVGRNTIDQYSTVDAVRIKQLSEPNSNTILGGIYTDRHYKIYQNISS